MRKSTVSEFIKKSKKIHGEFYGYTECLSPSIKNKLINKIDDYKIKVA